MRIESPKEALRWLKRRLSDAGYRCVLADQHDQRPLEQVGLPDHAETVAGDLEAAGSTIWS